MTTEEIQEYIDAAIRSKFGGFRAQSGEFETSEAGDGRFVGKVAATRYAGLPGGNDIFLAIGRTEGRAQIVKLGKSECLKPAEGDLDFMLLKELGIE